MKKIFRKLAIYVVTAYARYLFNKAKESADELYSKTGRMHYVATEVFNPGKLTIYDKDRFKGHKKVFGYHARLLTLQSLKKGCYYHTPDAAGNQAMWEHEIDRRRRFFIYERLKLAKLV